MIHIGLDTDNDGNPDGVWILQNSWDDTQYIEYYVAYTSQIPALCGVKAIKEKDWDNVYNLSNSPIIKYSGTEIGQQNEILDYVPDYAKENIFFVKYVNYAVSGSVTVEYNRPKNKSEKIKSINFASASQNSKFNIYVSDDGSEENYRFLQELRTDMPGIYTVDVEDVVLNSEKFSVKIETNDGALYQIINVFCDDYESFEDIGETNSHIEFALLNSDNMFEYQITSNIYGIDDGEIITYHTNASNIEVSNSIVRNNQAIGKVKVQSNRMINSEYTIDIMHNDDVIDTVTLVHSPVLPDDSIQGSGTSEDPYILTNASQLSMISYSPTAYFVLGNDIDLNPNSENEATFNNGIGWVPINTFYGVLDGNGHSIKNMCIYSTVLEDVTEEKNVGLFKVLQSASVCNLKIENATIISNDGKKSNVGILAGEANGGARINNVLVSGSIECEIGNDREANCGLLLGKLDVGANSLDYLINNITCQGIIDTKGYKNVGGFVGKYEGTYPASLDNMMIVTQIRSAVNENTNVGEIFGEGDIRQIKNSYIIPSNRSWNIDIFSGTRTTYSIRIKNSVLYKNNESDILDTIKENDSYSNYIYSDNIDELKNISIEQSGLNSDVWRYMQGNPYPTLKDHEIKFISDIVVPKEIHLNKGENKKIDVNIQSEEATFKKLQYTAIYNSVIEVDQYGKLTAKEKDGTVVITVLTCDGSNIIKKIRVTVEQGVEPYKISKYTVDEDKKTIGNIFPTTIEHYKENMALESSYTAKVFKIKTENEVQVEEEVTEGNIATGMITKIYLNDEIVAEYTNIVPGDVYIDGKVNSRDAGMTQQYLVGMKDELFETPQYYAMDFTRDGKVRLNDVELIMRYVVKLYEPSEEDYYGENN